MRNLFRAFLFFFLLPSAVFGECTCEPEELGDENKTLALRYKVGAITSILVASAVGVFLPVASRRVPALSPDRNFFFIVKAFAAGVILSTGLIHVLPNAFENLTSPCISESPWAEFPFTGFVAMVAAIGTLMVDAYAMSYFKRRSGGKMESAGRGDEERPAAQVHGHGAPGHAHGSEMDYGEVEILRHRVISQVLELGIVVHSVIIGIALGTSESPKTARPLTAALTFHQFFEGISLGGCITQAKFDIKAATIMGIFFSITTPTGIAIGIGISNIYSETSPTALIVQGILDAASAGILIYMALVDLLAADFMSPKMQRNGKLLFWANISLLIGAGCMSLLAKWA